MSQVKNEPKKSEPKLSLPKSASFAVKFYGNTPGCLWRIERQGTIVKCLLNFRLSPIGRAETLLRAIASDLRDHVVTENRYGDLTINHNGGLVRLRIETSVRWIVLSADQASRLADQFDESASFVESFRQATS